MAALVHHEGRILVTGDDVVPMIDVNAEFSPATLSSDLYWLMKVKRLLLERRDKRGMSKSASRTRYTIKL